MKRKVWIAILFLFLIPAVAGAANEWQGGTQDNPLKGSELINDIDTQFANEILEPLERNLIESRFGMRIKYDSASQVKVTSGAVVCADSSDVLRIRRNTSDTTVTWSDIDTGSESSSTTYYVYAVCDADATTATFTISTSSSAPSGKTYYKRLGSFLNNSSSNIEQIENDDERVAIGGGGISHGNTISPPSGWDLEECIFQAMAGSCSLAADSTTLESMQFSADGDGTVTCQCTGENGNTDNGQCRYLIICDR